ncbi:MAG: PLP-dependent aspartate aminotransferase family protein [Ramlibacter sp.]
MKLPDMPSAATAFNGHRFDSLVPPVLRASTVRFDSLDEFLTRGERLPDGYSYGTTGTPTHRHLEARIAALDGARHGLVVPSGQAAIALTLLHLLSAGDHLLISASAYGPAVTFAEQHLRRLGVQVQVYDPRVGAGIASLLQPDTRLVWLESPGSLTMEVQDVQAIAAVARRAGVPTAIDNTWSSPLYATPLAQGVTLCIHACTKYMGGHSDLLMGSITTNDEALYAGLRNLQAYMGQAASAEDCFLVERGLDTLAVRMQAQSSHALALADALAGHPLVQEVLHPALPSSRDHALWQQQFSGSGAVFSFVPRLQGDSACRAFFSGLSQFVIGASWGSVHSLAAFYPAALLAGRPFSPVQGPLIRLSVGLEDPAALKADVLDALQRMQAAG